MNINNRAVRKEDITFFQWLNYYKLITKKEYKLMPEAEQQKIYEEYKKFSKICRY